MYTTAYYLPDWVPGSHYVDLARSLGLKDVKTADWSAHVVRYCSYCSNHIYLHRCVVHS